MAASSSTNCDRASLGQNERLTFSGEVMVKGDLSLEGSCNAQAIHLTTILQFATF